MFGLDTACTTSKPPRGPGREEMASLPEIREMETKTEPKMTKLRNYKPQNIYTNGIITLDLINEAEICVLTPLSFWKKKVFKYLQNINMCLRFDRITGNWSKFNFHFHLEMIRFVFWKSGWVDTNWQECHNTTDGAELDRVIALNVGAVSETKSK